jgi:hypothetical protein
MIALHVSSEAARVLNILGCDNFFTGLVVRGCLLPNDKALGPERNGAYLSMTHNYISFIRDLPSCEIPVVTMAFSPSCYGSSSVAGVAGGA